MSEVRGTDPLQVERHGVLEEVERQGQVRLVVLPVTGQIRQREVGSVVVTEKEAEQYVYLPWEKVMDPHGHLAAVYRNHWWVVDPVKGLVFWKDRLGNIYPQCNTDVRLFDRVTFPEIEGHVVRFVPMALISRGENGNYFI